MKLPPAERRHLDTRTVLDYLEDRLDASSRARVESHLAGSCARCRQQFHETARLLGAMRVDRAPAVPESLRSEVLGLFAIHPPVATPEPSGWRLAHLLFDSMVEPLPEPVRRAVGEARWLQIGLAEDHLELEIEPESMTSVTVRGRLGATEPALSRIDVRSGHEIKSAWPDAEGRFAIEHVPRGTAWITIQGPTVRWRLRELEL
jgi:anti-sigma factor ChrR (cupin superfamily)